MEDADGRLDVAERRFLGVPSSQLAPQAAVAYAAAQAQEAERGTAHVQPVEARWFACAADAEAAMAEDAGRGQGRRGRQPRPGRYPGLPYQVAAVRVPQKRTRRGRPPQAEAPQGEARYRRVVPPEALVPSADAHGWPVLAPTMQPEGCTETERLQAYQEQHSTVVPGFRWIKHPAAISPVWLAKPARLAALAMRTVVGLLGYAVSQRQGRLSLHAHDQHVPGNTGPTATPTAAVGFALFAPVRLVQCAMAKATSREVQGVQGHHRIVCDAVGIDPAWYQGRATGQNSLPRATPP